MATEQGLFSGSTRARRPTPRRSVRETASVHHAESSGSSDCRNAVSLRSLRRDDHRQRGRPDRGLDRRHADDAAVDLDESGWVRLDLHFLAAGAEDVTGGTLTKMPLAERFPTREQPGQRTRRADDDNVEGAVVRVDPEPRSDRQAHPTEVRDEDLGRLGRAADAVDRDLVADIADATVVLDPAGGISQLPPASLPAVSGRLHHDGIETDPAGHREHPVLSSNRHIPEVDPTP